jgi:hypothetical protein
MRFSNGPDFLELELVDQSEAASLAEGDACFFVAVSSAGFSGAHEVWVHSAALRAFCSALVALDGARKGEASLSSISPGELELTIGAVSSLGHLAISGELGLPVRREHGLFDHLVRFGFEFDSRQLSDAADIEWVHRNAD